MKIQEWSVAKSSATDHSFLREYLKKRNLKIDYGKHFSR
jgi:hypothetical protein